MVIKILTKINFVLIFFIVMPLGRLNRFRRTSFSQWPFRTLLVLREGLYGFERVEHFELVGNQNEVPFLRLKAIGNQFLTFIVIDPFLINKDYNPFISEDDLHSLHKDHLILLAVVNPKESPYTVNLAAPILIDWVQRIGRQILVQEDDSYPIVSTSF